MYLYRIEHIDTHKGPYNESFLLGKHCDDNHPSMWDEFKRTSVSHQRETYYCAFNSIEKMLQWFAGYFDSLIAADYVIGCYVATDVQHGAVQSIFHMPTATRVDEFPIDVIL